MNALISVSDKTGVVELAQALHAMGVKLISTGGTAQLLAAQGLPVRDAGSVDKLGLDAAVRSSEHRAISAALSGAANRLEAAKLLGISPRTLRYKLAQLRDHGLSVSHGK